MSPALNRLLVRAGRWPRRIAVVVCLALAVSSAAQTRAARHPSKPPDPLARLNPGQVAVPITLDQPGTSGLLHAGDRVGLMSDGDLLADGLLVLSAPDPSADRARGQSILVAADRATALHITSNTQDHILAVLDKSP